jgi:hypothetical protein
MSHVYVVQHVHESQDGKEEDVKFIGVYRTRSDADAAVSRLRLLPGFRDHPDGFEVTEYELNKDHWMEGFISWKEAVEQSHGGEDSPRD